MALLQIYRYTNYENGNYDLSGGGTLLLNPGHRVDVYWDDVLSDFYVEAGGTEIIGASSFLDDYYLQNFNLTFCETTTLVEFTNQISNIPFPFAEKVETPNAASCQAYVCDLILDGSPLITPDEGTDNGTITVFALSTGDIEYGLNQSFLFGEGQASNTFTGLVAGNYTVYVRDSFNCLISVEVTVPSGVTYVPKYRAEWDDEPGTAKFEILERNYEGDPIDVKLSNFYALDWRSQNANLYEDQIRPGSFEISLYNEFNNQSQFAELYTQDDRKFLGIYYLNNTEVWRGYITPAVFSKQFFGNPRFTFIDGLKILENIPLLDNDERLYGNISEIKLIAFILKKTGLELPIKSGINIFAQGMASNPQNDPLAQAYKQTDLFYQDEEAWDCYRVLEQILRPYGAFIKQYKGQWIIQRYEELGTEYSYRIFNSDGNYVSNGTESVSVNFTCPNNTDRIININKDGLLEIMPAYGKVTVLNKLSLKDNLVPNGNFEREGYNTPFRDWNFIPSGNRTSLSAVETEEGRSASISTTEYFDIDDVNTEPLDTFLLSKTFPVRYGPADKMVFSFDFGFDKIDNAFPFLVVRWSMSIGPLGGPLQYIDEQGVWQDTEQINRYYPTPAAGFQKFKLEFFLPEVTDFTSEFIQIRIYNSNSQVADYGYNTSVSDIQDISAYDKPIGYKFSSLYWASPQTDQTLTRIRFYELVSGDPPDNNTLTTDITPNDVDPPAWSAITTYDPGDYVASGGETYVALATNLNDSPPSANWQQYDDVAAYWRFVKEIRWRSKTVHNLQFIIDNVDLDYKPSGLNPKEEEKIAAVNSLRIPEQYEVELEMAGLPINGSPNDRNIYLNHSSDAFQIPFVLWGRKGIDEAVTIQDLYLQMVANQHYTPSKKISGTFISKEVGGVGIEVGPNNVIFNTFDSKYYAISNLTINKREYRIEMIEVKLSDGGVPVFRAHSSGHSIGHN